MPGTRPRRSRATCVSGSRSSSPLFCRQRGPAECPARCRPPAEPSLNTFTMPRSCDTSKPSSLDLGRPDMFSEIKALVDVVDHVEDQARALADQRDLVAAPDPG